jgi:hypothetical protein
MMHRKAWAIALRDLYARLFRKHPHYTHLTRWVDLEEELMNL